MQRQDFWSKFHRVFHWGIIKYGIEFDYKGDDVEWVLPWKRNKPNEVFFSISFMRCYKSLKDLDKEWADFAKAYNDATDKYGPAMEQNSYEDK